jgi:hypothetical protein
VQKLLKRYAATCCLTLVLTLGTGSPYAQEFTEYNIKAGYIYKFLKLFVEWPGELAVSKRSAIDICVIGDSELIKEKSMLPSSEKLSISLVQENNPENAANHCHVVFIGESESAKLKDILAALRGKPVLTVSDLEGFAERGGMIEFVMVGDNIKFIIDPKPAVNSALRLDAQLLEAAIKVIGR